MINVVDPNKGILSGYKKEWNTDPTTRNETLQQSESESKVNVKPLSRVRLFVTPWTAAHQAPPSMRCSRQEYWSGLPLPSPENLPRVWLKKKKKKRKNLAKWIPVYNICDVTLRFDLKA